MSSPPTPGADTSGQVLHRRDGAEEAAAALTLDAAGDHGHGRDHATDVAKHQCGDRDDRHRHVNGRQVRHHDEQHRRNRNDRPVDEELSVAVGEFSDERVRR